MPPKRPTSPLFPVSANRPFISRNQDMLTTLRTKYPTFTELESHLSKLDESAARAFVLKIAYPEVSSPSLASKNGSFLTLYVGAQLSWTA